MSITKPILALAAGSSLLLCGAAVLLAQGSAGAEPAYLAGGIGTSGREELAAVQDQYSLKLVFAYTTGSFLANVVVEIADARGEALLDTVSSGPWMLVKLPPGRYRVTGTLNGVVRSTEVEVPGQGLREVNLRWPPG